MNYTLKPSLEHIALVKIATTLWNQDDINALIAKFSFPLRNWEAIKKWQEIEDKVVEKVPHLPQPEPLKEEILCFIRPVGLQILKWMEYHQDLFSRNYIKRNSSRLFWTPQGTVDNKKTAEILIKDGSLDIAKSYKLACIYCLEDDVLELWNKIPENRRKFFYSEEDPRKISQKKLVVLWTYDIKGEVDKMDNMIEKRWLSKCSPYQYAFEYSAVGGNKAATEYFLQKLIPKERKESLVRSAIYVANIRCDYALYQNDLLKELCTDVLCFLLSQMDEEQQIEVFKSYPYEVLKCLLDWPWQSFFLETANHMWSFLSEKAYDVILSIIVNRVLYGYKDCDYQNLFGEFWHQSPTVDKKYVINRCTKGLLLTILFEVEDKKNITSILNKATSAEKEKLIFSDRGKDICESLIFKDNWDLLRLFIGKCISFKEKIIKFKEEFKGRSSRYCSKQELIDRFNKFFQLLDDLAQENKEKSGESSPAKRLCSIEFKVEHSMKK